MTIGHKSFHKPGDLVVSPSAWPKVNVGKGTIGLVLEELWDERDSAIHYRVLFGETIVMFHPNNLVKYKGE